MISFNLSIKDGNYLWDYKNKELVRYGFTGTVIIGLTSNNEIRVQTAFPIPLYEEMLGCLGFESNNNGEYVNGDKVIKIDGTNSTSVLCVNDNPVVYVSDVQNIYTDLNIDEVQLRNACLLRLH